MVADVAVLRSFPSQVFAPVDCRKATCGVEQALIERRACFQIIYDHHLADLSRYRALVLAGCAALSDEHIGHIKHYVATGGRLCVLGPLATHDEWLRPRETPALDDLPGPGIVRVPAIGDLPAAVKEACGHNLSLQIGSRQADPSMLGLCAELTEQPTRRLVHLVNYRPAAPFTEVSVQLRVPAGRQATAVRLAGPRRERDMTLAFTQTGDSVTFDIPAVDLYEIAVVDMA